MTQSLTFTQSNQIGPTNLQVLQQMKSGDRLLQVWRFHFIFSMMVISRRRRNTGGVQGDTIQDPRISSSCQPVLPEEFRNSFNYRVYSIPNINKSPNVDQEPGLSTTKSLIFVAIIFLFSLLALRLLYKSFPDLEKEEKQHLKLPRNLEDAKQLGLILDRYKHKYFYEVLFGVFTVYIFLQTFAIPGSLFLSILSGFLFPFYLALLLVCCCSAIGASLCFFVSNLLGKKLVQKFYPEKAANWSETVEKHRDNLLNYVIFLRVTPFLPNWFINITAPVIGVPLVPFALGTFIGVAPPSFVAIQAGQTLNTLTSTSDTWSWTSVTILTIFALFSLVPVVMKQKLREKFD